MDLDELVNQERANQELHARTIEVLKKLKDAMEPASWSRLQTPLYAHPVLTADELALLMYHCGISKEDLK